MPLASPPWSLGGMQLIGPFAVGTSGGWVQNEAAAMLPVLVPECATVPPSGAEQQGLEPPGSAELGATATGQDQQRPHAGPRRRHRRRAALGVSAAGDMAL